MIDCLLLQIMSDNSSRIPSSDRVLRSSTKPSKKSQTHSETERKSTQDLLTPIPTPNPNSSIVRRKGRNKNSKKFNMDEDLGTYVKVGSPRSGSSSPFFDDEDTNETHSSSPSRANRKLYETHVINNGEKAHLLMEDSLDDSSIDFGEGKILVKQGEESESESFWTITVSVKSA